MPSDSDHPFAACRSLEEAWHLVNRLQLSCGIIAISSDLLNGGFAFMDGRIVGAYIDESGVRGELALQMLMQARNAHCDFLPFSRENLATDVGRVHDVVTGSEPIYTGAQLAYEPAEVTFSEPISEPEVTVSSPPQPSAVELMDGEAVYTGMHPVYEPELGGQLHAEPHVVLPEIVDPEETISQPVFSIEEPQYTISAVAYQPNMDPNFAPESPSSAWTNFDAQPEISDAVQTVEVSNANFATTVELPSFASSQGIMPPPKRNPTPPDSQAKPARKPLAPKVAAEVLKHLAAAEELQEFLNYDGKLDHNQPTLDANQLRLLDIVRELSDPELFEEEAVTNLKDFTSLTDTQASELQSAEAIADPVTFNLETEDLKQEGLQITDEQLLVLGEVLAARSLEQQKSEFVEQDQNLQNLDKAELKEFVEPPPPEAPAEPLPPVVLGTPAFPSDYKGVETSVEVDASLAKVQGAAELEGKSGEYERPVKVNVNYVKYGAPALVAVLCVALYIVPAMVKAPATAEAKLAAEQTRWLIDEEVRAQSPRVQRSELPPGRVMHATAPSSTTATGAAPAEEDPDPIAEARIEASGGNIAKAIEILEKTVESNPYATQARIDLVRIYKAKKKFKRARLLALIGFRAAGCTPAQRDELWKLFKECLEEEKDENAAG